MANSNGVLARLSNEDVILLAYLVVAIVEVELNDPNGAIQQFSKQLQEEEERRQRNENRLPRRIKDGTRKRFSVVISEEFPENIFRRYFRMGRDSFFRFCNKICDAVGENHFMPERLMDDINNAHRGAVRRSGGVICGEVRVAIFIRLLAGASYLDLMVIFDLAEQSVLRSFRLVCDWVSCTFEYPLVKALNTEDVEYFDKITHDFAYSASNGVFMGCIGAVDGLAIKIKQPTATKELTDPGAYYCRKGYFALNCQAICDFDKRIAWISTRHIGSCHDSAAFAETRLYGLLQQKSEFLTKNGYFIVGDSAYNMESFLLVPYPQPAPRSAEDAYNYYHSNCRIRIECTFGEFIMRWGIFWRTLQFDIGQIGKMVSCAGLVHNFIVDERVPDDHLYIRNFSYYNDVASMDNDHRETAYAIVTDNNMPRPRGRPSTTNVLSKEVGRRMRLALCLQLANRGMTRPMQEGFKYNDCGMVYMDY